MALDQHPEKTPAGCDAVGGCFDCNICLDFCKDPVVTLCGHLYCWPCVYKWLTTQQSCPVCKSSLSQAALVPLYGRGAASKPPENIPHRPPATLAPPIMQQTRPIMDLRQHGSSSTNNVADPQQYYHYHHHHHYPIYNQFLSPNFASGRAVHGGMVCALLPWVVGLVFGCPQSVAYHSDPDYLGRNDDVNDGRLQRQRQAEMSLNRVSIFLLCCLVLCLFLF